MTVRQENCGYRNDDWPTSHSCLRNKGHPRRHRCWCGSEHGSESDRGRWEDYTRPEIRGDKI